MNFGNYDPLNDSIAEATITATCTAGGSVNPYIGLNLGTYPNQETNKRNLLNFSGGTPTALDYEIYGDSARSKPWGETTTSGAVQFVASGKPQQLTAFGKIPSGQSVRAGSFSDTVVVTINY